MSQETAVTSFSVTARAKEVSKRLQRAQPWSDGELLLMRVWLEALTPGVGQLHNYLKALTEGLAPPSPNQRPLTEPELAEWLERDPRLTELFELTLDALMEAREWGWWRTTKEVADCGAQREVLTKLVYRKLSSEYERHLPHMTEWSAAWARLGGLELLYAKLCKDLNEVQATVARELIAYALSELAPPKALAPEELERWLHAHRGLRDALYRAAWEEARARLKPLSELSPKCAQLLLAWATLKGKEKLFDESFKGVERALKYASPALSDRLREALPRWRALLAPPPEPEVLASHEGDQAGREAHREHREHREVTFGLSVRGGGGQGAHEPETAQTVALDGQLQALLSALPLGGLAGGSWEAPLALLQSFAQLGVDRAHGLTSRAVLSEVIELVREARRQVSHATVSYPEAQGLKGGGRALAAAEQLLMTALRYAPSHVEGGPPIYGVSPYGGAHGGPHGAAAHNKITHSGAERPYSLESLTVTPPLSQQALEGTLASTALIEQINDIRLSDELALSPPSAAPLSLEGDSRVELTLNLPPDLDQAQALMRAGDFTQAEHCLLSLLDQNPFNPQAHNDLGVLNFQLHRFGDAKAHLILAIECEPSYEEAWENLIELFTSLGQLHHALPLFRRFEKDLEALASYPRLKALCERFAPQGYEAMAPPARDPSQEGLRLPLSGSFFVAPEAGEDPLEALSGEHPDIEQNAHVIAEAKARAQQDIANHLRVDVQSMLDAWRRELYTPPLQPRGLIPWIKAKLGQRPALPAPPPELFDELSLATEGLEEEIRALERAPEPIPTKALPIDQRRVRNVAFDMLCVPSGTFLMGSDQEISSRTDHEHPRHRVVLSRAFQLAQMPVTQELYEAVMWINPSHNKAPGNPVVRVNWFDAVRFCNKLSELEGLPPAFKVSYGSRPEVAFIPDSLGYRLPTEAEWEYSARARQGYLFSGGPDVHKVAWVASDELHTVGRKEANPWGFHDMSGNVWEWCADGLREYQAEPMLDPVGDLLTYMHTPGARVIRGGSWCFEADGARVSFRGRGAPGLRITSLGFRVARSV